MDTGFKRQTRLQFCSNLVFELGTSSVSFIRNQNLFNICLGDAEKIQFQFSTWNTNFGRGRRKIRMGRNQVNYTFYEIRKFATKICRKIYSPQNERFDGRWRPYIWAMKMYDLDHLYSWACLIPYRGPLSWHDLERKFVLGFYKGPSFLISFWKYLNMFAKLWNSS